MAGLLLPTSSNSITNLLTVREVLWYFFLAACCYLCYKIVSIVIYGYQTSKRYHDIPSLPRSKITGNLLNAGKYLDPSIPRHPDYGIEEMWEQLDRPPFFLMDLAPIDYGVVVIADPKVAEVVVSPSDAYRYSVPKSDTLGSLHRLVGLESMLMKEGEEWKVQRRRFNKGFSHAHLQTLGPLIIDKMRIFKNRLLASAESGETFLMKDYSADLTTDIITELAMKKDFGAQNTPEGKGHKSPTGFLTATRLLSSLCAPTGRGIALAQRLDISRPIRGIFYEAISDWHIRQALLQAINRAEKPSGSKKELLSEDATSGKTIVDLALSGLTPTPALIKDTVHQIKTFLFAGQDTTSTAIQWSAYELSKASYSPAHSKIVERLRTEHDSVFGSHNYTLSTKAE